MTDSAAERCVSYYARKGSRRRYMARQEDIDGLWDAIDEGDDESFGPLRDAYEENGDPLRRGFDHLGHHRPSIYLPPDGDQVFWDWRRPNETEDGPSYLPRHIWDAWDAAEEADLTTAPNIALDSSRRRGYETRSDAFRALLAILARLS